MVNNAADKIPIDYETVIPKSTKKLCIANVVVSLLALVFIAISFIELKEFAVSPGIKELLENILTFTVLSSAFFWTFSLVSLFFQFKNLIYIAYYKECGFKIFLYTPFSVSLLLTDLYIILQIILFMTI